MDMIGMITGINFGSMGMGSVVFVLLGACVGWVVPQPAFMTPVINFVCEKFKLTRFHEEGHVHSDEHEAEKDETK